MAQTHLADEDDHERGFVDKEIDRTLDLWKHADDRVGAGYTLLVTLIAALVSVAALLFRTSSVSRTSLCSVAAALLVFAGVLSLSSFRMLATEITKTELLAQANLLRAASLRLKSRYAPAFYITPLPAAQPAVIEDWVRHQVGMRFPRVGRRAIYCVVFICTSVGLALAAWSLYSPLTSWSPWHIVALPGCALLAAVITATHRSGLRRFECERIAVASARYIDWLELNAD